MASVKPFFLSNFFFFMQFMAFTFAADTTSTKANTLYPKPLQRTAPITEIKKEKVQDEANRVTEFAGVTYNYQNVTKVEAILTVWRPYVAISDGVNSFCQLKIFFEELGTGYSTQSLEAGWIVEGNGGKPRFYVNIFSYKWKRDCRNLECGAFKVARGARNRLNSDIQPISIYGGQNFEINVTINHEYIENTLAWTVYLQGTIVGYYSDTAFRSLVAANRVDCGGGVTVMSKGPGTPHSGTEMGSGHFSVDNLDKAASVKKVELYTGDGSFVDYKHISIVPYWTNINCYDVDNWDSYFYYGGPGGKEKGCTNVR